MLPDKVSSKAIKTCRTTLKEQVARIVDPAAKQAFETLRTMLLELLEHN